MLKKSSAIAFVVIVLSALGIFGFGKLQAWKEAAIPVTATIHPYSYAVVEGRTQDMVRVNISVTYKAQSTDEWYVREAVSRELAKTPLLNIYPNGDDFRHTVTEACPCSIVHMGINIPDPKVLSELKKLDRLRKKN